MVRKVGEGLAFALATMVVLAVGYVAMMGASAVEDSLSSWALPLVTAAEVVALLLLAFLAGRRGSWAGVGGIVAAYLVWLAIPVVL
jgi:hypothetical protein